MREKLYSGLRITALSLAGLAASAGIWEVAAGLSLLYVLMYETEAADIFN